MDDLDTSSTRIDVFRSYRQRMNERISEIDHLGIKRFFRLDTAAYEPGALDPKTKELLGLVASAVLRCNDCVDYHLDQCIDAGWNDAELYEALNVALVVGGKYCHSTSAPCGGIDGSDSRPTGASSGAVTLFPPNRRSSCHSESEPQFSRLRLWDGVWTSLASRFGKSGVLSFRTQAAMAGSAASVEEAAPVCPMPAKYT